MDSNSNSNIMGIAQYFIDNNSLNYDQILQYQQLAQTKKISLIRCLLDQHIIPSKTMAKLISEYFNLPFLDLDLINLNTIPEWLLMENILRQYKILPLFELDQKIHIAIDDPSNYEAIQSVKFHLNKPILLFVVEDYKLDAYLKIILQRKDHHHLTNYFAKNHSENHDNYLTDNDAPVIQWINRIILQAIEHGASDIHFEPYECLYRIRYRQDGILHEVDSPPLSLSTRIASRIKIMANLDISEQRLPQDGRFSLHKMDCRVSICPTVFGEKIVIRLLNNSHLLAQIDTLALNSNQKTLFLNAIQRPQGMILVTGPTGSGKTLTLYSALNYLNIAEKNIFTAEDPVEIYMQGINQVQIDTSIGRDFPEILRAFLRQDPDIIMIGEMRDLKTADIAIKASQTGHLVLSTLHTNSTSQTLTRLLNMGVNNFHLAHSINLIIAQRLVRKLCDACKQLVNQTIYQAQGCEQCIQGYRGRIAIFEIMPISNQLQSMILSSASSADLLQQAKKEGMQTLYEDGVAKIHAGITTWDEINRVAME